jgi:hypothetical protein
MTLTRKLATVLGGLLIVGATQLGTIAPAAAATPGGSALGTHCTRNGIKGVTSTKVAVVCVNHKWSLLPR